jgi:hypothetical protein
MRAWIDRTNDGLSGMPADGISLPPKKGGPRHVPLGPVRGLGYINHAIDGREHDRCWPESEVPQPPLMSAVEGANRKTFARSELYRI